MSKRYIGIDLGTTNSTVSVANLTIHGDIEANTLEVKQVDDTGGEMVLDETLPSVLYIDDTDQPYVGRFAKRMLGVYPQRVIREVKRHMGDDVSWNIGEESIRPEEVSSYILKILKAQTEEYYNDDTIDSCVITIPANFDFQKQQATKQAGELSGFHKDKIHMIPEPTAALIYFLNEEKKIPVDSRRLDMSSGRKNLMVFDLGGGTCDVSILQVSQVGENGMDIQELSISQYTELGGLDFDRKVRHHLMEKLLKQVNLTMQTLRTKYKPQDFALLGENLLDFAENAKKSFSTRIENHLRIHQVDYYDNPAQFDDLTYRHMLHSDLPEELVQTLEITKKEYDEVIRSLLYEEDNNLGQNIEEPIVNSLKYAKIGPMQVTDIDAVFLVGGMTYYHTVQERIHEIFEQRLKPIQSINPMLSVSRGAAIYHHQIDSIQFKSSDEITEEAREKLVGSDIIFQNTVPTTVYVDVVGNDPVPILEKGTTLPYERIIPDKFIVTGPSGATNVTAMKLELFTAPSAKSIQTNKLKSAVITFKKPVPVNSRIVLKVNCNEEREVSVKAWLENDTSEVLDVNIGAHEFSEEELQSLREKQEKINKILS